MDESVAGTSEALTAAWDSKLPLLIRAQALWMESHRPLCTVPLRQRLGKNYDLKTRIYRSTRPCHTILYLSAMAIVVDDISGVAWLACHSETRFARCLWTGNK
jgi:hypothetical protein